MPDGRVILLAARIEVLRQILVGIAEAIRALHPQFLASHLLAQRRQHTPFVGDAVDAATVLVVDHQFLPVVPDDAVQRHLLVLWKDCGLVVPVLVEQSQGVHHGAMQVVVALERQHLQQRRHDAPVMMTVGGARHQLYPMFVSLIGLYFLNQILESSLADGREDHFLNRAVRMSSGRLGNLVQQFRLSQDLLGVLQQLAVHLLLGPHAHPMGDVNQQFHQVVGDLALALPAERGKQGITHLGRVPPHLARRLRRGTLPVVSDELTGHVVEQVVRQIERA